MGSRQHQIALLFLTSIVPPIPNVCFISYRFRPVKGKIDGWKARIEKFKQCQDYEKTYKDLILGDCLKTFFLTKSKAQKAVFKEHVCTS